MPSPIDLIVRIRADVAGASRNIGTATTSADKLKAGIKGAGVAAAGAVAGMVALGAAAAQAASRQEQAFGSLESVYGKQAKAQQDLATDAAKTTGLSAAQYAEMSSKLGASLKNMGLDQVEAGKKSKDLIGLGADLSAAFGGSSADAVDALGSALRGEADPAERYGLALSQTAIKAELAKRGQDKLTGSALQSAKAAAILSLATTQAGGAIGQFGRESGGAAGSAQIAAAQFENTKAQLGTALLPVLVAVSAALSTFSNFLSQNIGLVTTIAAVVGGFAAAILLVNGAMAIYNGIQTLMAAKTAIVTAAQWLWNAALTANPIGLIVVAIAAFVAAIVVLFNKSEGFRNFVLGMWAAIKTAAEAAWNGVKAAISTVIEFIGSAIRVMGGVVTGVWDGIKSAASTVWNAIVGIVQGVISTVSSAWRTFVSGFGAVIGGIKATVSTVFNAVKTIIQGVVTAIGTVIGKITTTAAAVWTAVKTAAQAAWLLIQSYIITPLTAAITFIQTTFAGIATFLSNLWTGIVTTATNILGGLATAASTAFSGITGVIKSVLNGIIGFINTYAIGPINSLIDTANKLPFVNIGHIGNIPTFGSGVMAAGPSEEDFRRLFSPGTTSRNDSTTINISGALDPDATARRVAQLLTSRSRRIGVTVIGGGAVTRPAQWDLLNCVLYVDGVRVEDGSTPGATDAQITVLAGLSVQWGRETTVDQPGPASCGFELMDLDGRNGFLALVAVGRRVDVEARGGGVTVRVFSGRITDASAVWDAGLGGIRVSATAVDLLGALGSMLVATKALPVEGLFARLQAFITTAGYTGDVVIDPTIAALMVSPVDIDRQSALQVLQDLIAGVDAVLWAASTVAAGAYLLIENTINRVPLLELTRASGGFVQIVPAVTLPAGAVSLDACDVLLDPVEWVQDVSDVATRVIVDNDAEGTGYRITKRSSQDYNQSATGIRSVSVSTPLLSLFDGEAVAERLIYRLSYSGWRINGVTLDLRSTADLAPAEVSRAIKLLSGLSRLGCAIQLTGLPEWSPVQGNQAVYLEGGTYTYDGAGWLLQLTVSNGAGLGDSVHYNQLDTSWDYGDFAPSITYNSLIGVGP